MNRLTTLVLIFATCASFGVAAQWQWKDRDGRRVFSDRPPPADIAEQDVLKRPGGTQQKGETVSATASSPVGVNAPIRPASAPRAGASAPALKIGGKESPLEAKKKEAEAQEAAKQKVEDDKLTAAKAENCQRARQSKAGLDSGVRIQTTNEKGEREFLSDDARAAEQRRIQGILGECQ